MAARNTTSVHALEKEKKKLRQGGIGQRMVPLAFFPCSGLGKANQEDEGGVDV